MFRVYLLPEGNRQRSARPACPHFASPALCMPSTIESSVAEYVTSVSLGLLRLVMTNNIRPFRKNTLFLQVYKTCTVQGRALWEYLASYNLHTTLEELCTFSL